MLPEKKQEKEDADISSNQRNVSLLRYASIGTQLLAGIGISVFIGLKADGWLKLKIPLLVWILPLLLIISVTLKLIRATSKRK
jgi:hypothetical protein